MATRSRDHTCHADGCEISCPPRMLMHLEHWRMVPRPLQRAVYAEYVEGQENRLDPTPAYLLAAEEAIVAVAVKERRLSLDDGAERVQRHAEMLGIPPKTLF